MARKVNEENERIKRAYLIYFRDVKRRDEVTVHKVADAILRFEASTGYKSFKRFHIEQARTFKAKLANDLSSATGTPLSKATVSGILRANKAFFQRLAEQPGYKSRISYSDADYFNHPPRTHVSPTPSARHGVRRSPSVVTPSMRCQTRRR